jgi:hypothetical protein
VHCRSKVPTPCVWAPKPKLHDGVGRLVSKLYLLSSWFSPWLRYFDSLREISYINHFCKFTLTTKNWIVGNLWTFLALVTGQGPTGKVGSTPMFSSVKSGYEVPPNVAIITLQVWVRDLHVKARVYIVNKSELSSSNLRGDLNGLTSWIWLGDTPYDSILDRRWALMCRNSMMRACCCALPTCMRYTTIIQSWPGSSCWITCSLLRGGIYWNLRTYLANLWVQVDEDEELSKLATVDLGALFGEKKVKFT